jgi:phospholipid-binding lipoprotein MlaA
LTLLVPTLLFVFSLLLPAVLNAQTVPVSEAGSEEQGLTDPLGGFNTRMFWFNQKLDSYFLHPVTSGYAKVIPLVARQGVGRFFDNVGVLPRFANNLFQFRLRQAGTEVTRFGVNSTIGLVGLFDPADKWFGLKENPDDFGLTLGRYSVPTGPYLVLPFFGPSTVRDAVGRVADGAMNPMSYLLPWYITTPVAGGEAIVDAVNYRSLNLELFEEVDRYSIDIYGAVQDGYVERRAAAQRAVDRDSVLPRSQGPSYMTQ